VSYQNLGLTTCPKIGGNYPDLEHEYRKYLANNAFTLSQFSSRAKGTTRQILTRDDFNSVFVVVPPPAEQQAIADYLDRRTQQIDSLIEKKQKQIELLNEQRTATISEAVTNGLDPDAKMKASGIDWLGEIPEHWEVRKVKYLCDGGLTNGIFKKRDQFGQGKRLVNVSDLYRQDHMIDFEGLQRVEVSSEEEQRYRVRPGDIFFVRSSLKLEGVGESACISEVGESCVFECHVVRLRPLQKEVSPFFLVNVLNCHPVRQKLVSISETVTMSTLSQGKITSVLLPVPPLNEQEAIEEEIRFRSQNINTLIHDCSQQISLLQEYRQALISEAVTGKIDVREVAA